jgi:diguanylate cyclase (GGDEF)-like protein
MRLSKRYALLGALAGLLAPAVLYGYTAVGHRTIDALWLAVLLAVAGVTIFSLLGGMVGQRDQILERLAVTDALTGISNRRSFDERLAMEVERTKRYGVACALVMVDLDRFKALNDRFGHQAGDEVLRRVAGLFESEKRAGDMVARYGGEEFAAILPHTTVADAAAWAERLRTRLAHTRIEWGDAEDLRITASFGVAGTSSWTAASGWLIDGADRSLYEAKRRGGNVVATSPTAETSAKPVAEDSHIEAPPVRLPPRTTTAYAAR